MNDMVLLPGIQVLKDTVPIVIGWWYDMQRETGVGRWRVPLHNPRDGSKWLQNVLRRNDRMKEPLLKLNREQKRDIQVLAYVLALCARDSGNGKVLGLLADEDAAASRFVILRDMKLFGERPGSTKMRSEGVTIAQVRPALLPYLRSVNKEPDLCTALQNIIGPKGDQDYDAYITQWAKELAAKHLHPHGA